MRTTLAMAIALCCLEASAAPPEYVAALRYWCATNGAANYRAIAVWPDGRISADDWPAGVPLPPDGWANDAANQSNAAAYFAEVEARPRLEPTGVHIPPTGALVVDDPATGAGYQIVADPYGVDVVGPVHGSPWLDAVARDALRQARKVERQAIRDAYRGEVEDAKTNRADCAAMRVAQTNAITQVQALTFGNSYNRAQVVALRDALVEDMRRQREALEELRQVNAELIDSLRLTRRQLMDTRPEATAE